METTAEECRKIASYTLWLKFYSPIVYYQPPTIDAIVSYCLAIEHAKAEGQFTQFCKPQAITGNDAGLNDLDKLIVHKGGAFGVPVSSFLQPVGETHDFFDSWKKRWDSEHSQYADFNKGARKVNTASGEFRSYNMPLPAHTIDAGWFAFIGDGKRVARLIRDNIIGIGKKVNEGFGWIDKIELRDSSLEWKNILKMRPVPLFLAENHGIHGRVQICGWKPPYWDRRNICECVVPE